MQIVVGVPHKGDFGATVYPIVREDGRIVFVKEYLDGMAALFVPGRDSIYRLYESESAPNKTWSTRDEAIEAAREVLLDME